MDSSILKHNFIYKVNYLVNDNIDTIYVFYGKKTAKEKDQDIIKKLFTEQEMVNFQTNKVTIKISEQQIHYDDTIGTIKIKILIELQKRICIEEVYLFSQQLDTLNAVSVYQSLTQNNKLELTHTRLEQFMSNIIIDEQGNKIIMPPKKEIYTFEDILDMRLNDKKYIINKVLGQKFFIVENEYPFVCDPYKINGYDTFFEKNARKSLSTLNSHILLNSGEILDNNIFVCLAEDVLKYVSQKDISEDYTIKIYYPFL
jgi:hypothetical protein